MINLFIQYDDKKLEDKQVSPATSIKDFKEYLLKQFPQLQEQIIISARIKSTKKEIDLYNDESAKLIEKYQLINNETIILIKVVSRQTLFAQKKDSQNQQNFSSTTPNSRRQFQFPKQCQNCSNYQDELKKKQIEIENLQQQLSKDHLPTLKTQNFMQNSSDNFFQTQNLSQAQTQNQFQTQSVFYKTQADSLQGKLLVEDLDKMLKQIYIGEIDQLKQRIKEKDIDTNKIKQHYEKLMTDTNDQHNYFKSQIIQDKEQLRQIYQEKFEQQSKEIIRLKEDLQEQSKNELRLKEIIQKQLEIQQTFISK